MAVGSPACRPEYVRALRVCASRRHARPAAGGRFPGSSDTARTGCRTARGRCTSPIGRGKICAADVASGVAIGLLDHRQAVDEERVTGVADRQRERHRQADVLGDVEHRLQRRSVVAGDQVGHELDQAAAGVLDAPRDRLDLGVPGLETRYRMAAFALVQGQPRRRETQRADLARPRRRACASGRGPRRSRARGRRRADPSRTPAAGSAAGTRRRRCPGGGRPARRGTPETSPTSTAARRPSRRRGCPRRRPSRRRASRGPRARHGAKPTPQLPITAVVTPCADDGVRRSDQMA